MKTKHILLSAVIGTGLSLVSCSDYLEVDRYFKDRMSLEEVFKSEDYSEEWLANAFSYLAGSNADVSSKGHTPFCFADDMYFGDRDDFYKKLKNGEYGEGDQQGSWGACYQGIRQASIFIQNIDMNEDFSAEEIADYKAQARFVRAYYYWLLLRKYGPVPLLPDEGLDYTDSYDNLARARNTYDEVADYIASEMALAAKDLPLTRGALAIARPTRGAALATRAKVLLYAASPINNPRPSDTEKFSDLVNFDGTHLVSQEYDESKWARAAAAARDVIELNVYDLYHAGIRTTASTGYPKTIAPPKDGDFSEHNWPDGWKDIDPYESYRSLFNGELAAEVNPELIFTRGQNQSSEGINVMVGHQLPRFTSGWNTHGLTQKQCDAYYMNDGSNCPGMNSEYANLPGYAGRVDNNSRVKGFVSEEEQNEGVYPELGTLSKGVSKQYARREPRFYASVAYNGSTWYFLNADLNENKGPRQIFYYRGGGNGYTNTMFWLRTGIGVMKFVHPNDANDNNSNDAGWTHIKPKAEPAIRYAEVLLIYAEALNELEGSHDIASWNGSKTYNIRRDVNEMKKGIRPVRCRAGVPDYRPEVYSNKDEFRKTLKRERQIELMGEGHRYYDLRRWKDAETEESAPIYGCNTLMTEEQQDLFHTIVEVPSLPTTFSRKMYFWPISHDELKSNKLLTQNPGWTYND
ncbi:RagB/SusD family nutrient uptake outer membrane protein [uncultured Bacteroides sp.]|uniref:RagB/SusD family nutrient uptake outer membrane protein n=1 Tax=uncultured Bacteroides sp. TaxID=162156 RepID=UPI002675B4D6|nr:RagB/SusD family nutrient uptake outer membrane protein [uncultured Bacteroides sp.]